MNNLFWVIIMNIKVRDFEVLSADLHKAIVYLRNCRTDVRNSTLFEYIDKAISVGNGYTKMIDGFKEMEQNNVDISRYEVIVNNNCDLAVSFIDEINRIKRVAQA